MRSTYQEACELIFWCLYLLSLVKKKMEHIQ
jgi:hypothetical protein